MNFLNKLIYGAKTALKYSVIATAFIKALQVFVNELDENKKELE